MNNKIYFKIEDDVLIKDTPCPEIGEDIYRTEIVINKETFIKCYEAWIENKENRNDEEDRNN